MKSQKCQEEWRFTEHVIPGCPQSVVEWKILSSAHKMKYVETNCIDLTVNGECGQNLGIEETVTTLHICHKQSNHGTKSEMLSTTFVEL